VAAEYGRRRQALIGALAERGVTAHGRSGLNVWVPVPDETGAVARLLHAGWAVAPGARYRLSAPPGIRITVSTLREEETEPLADAVATALSPAPARSYV
jgi:DNA-binding transcriptional MocR family regulator